MSHTAAGRQAPCPQASPPAHESHFEVSDDTVDQGARCGLHLASRLLHLCSP